MNKDEVNAAIGIAREHRGNSEVHLLTVHPPQSPDIARVDLSDSEGDFYAFVHADPNGSYEVINRPVTRVLPSRTKKLTASGD